MVCAKDVQGSRPGVPVVKVLVISAVRILQRAWDGDGMGWDGVLWDGIGWYGIRWDGMGRDGMGWDVVGYDGIGWDRVGWDGMGWD